MFKELEDVRPFELLRTSRDRSNYLLTMEARIIALTSTYAAIKHCEILELGFKYDNIIMEEAAQITEIESFIPLTLQRPKNDDNPLQRIISNWRSSSKSSSNSKRGTKTNGTIIVYYDLFVLEFLQSN